MLFASQIWPDVVKMFAQHLPVSWRSFVIIAAVADADAADVASLSPVAPKSLQRSGLDTQDGIKTSASSPAISCISSCTSMLRNTYRSK